MARRPSEFRSPERRGVVCGLETTRIGSAREFSDELAESREDGRPPVPRVGRPVHDDRLRAGPVAARVNTPAFDAAPGVESGPVSVRAGACDVRAVVNPSRHDVAAAVAHACRYNARLILRGGDRRDRETVLEYLEARSGRRLRASFGDPAGLRATPPSGA